MLAIVEATAPYAACFKPNIAFYEQHGIAGLRQLETLLAGIPGDIPVIGDMKRGDMGNTAEAYARAAFEQWDFGAVTVASYQGLDSVAPFLAYEDRGVYALCRTSNPSSAEFQDIQLANGRQLFEQVAQTATSWSPRVGLVVGATVPDELRRVREAVPDAPFLVPGVGAQGGDARSAIAAAGHEPGRVVVNSSRGISYASDGPDFAEAAAAAARALRDELSLAPAR
jgi:orotidine-5'-phosphate decarboxylase